MFLYAGLAQIKEEHNNNKKLLEGREKEMSNWDKTKK